MIINDRVALYSAKDIAFIIPTKDRPQKVNNLLESLAAQKEPCGRIIIVATGRDIEATVASFADRLPVEYYHTDQPGQIRQRNIGISKLGESTRLVGNLDDDIVLLPDALEKMIAFWNEAEPETAGVGFNIVNDTPNSYSLIEALFFSSSRQPGQVLLSGKNTKITNVNESIQTRWLNGGATIWQQDILVNRRHQEIKTRWAIHEDVIFSYPIGKERPLFICAEAQARHEHVQDHVPDRKKFLYYGKNKVMWHYYFVRSNKDLSTPAFYWSVIGSILGKYLKGLKSGGVVRDEATGELKGLVAVTRSILTSTPIIDVLNEV